MTSHHSLHLPINIHGLDVAFRLLSHHENFPYVPETSHLANASRLRLARAPRSVHTGWSVRRTRNSDVGTPARIWSSQASGSNSTPIGFELKLVLYMNALASSPESKQSTWNSI